MGTLFFTVRSPLATLPVNTALDVLAHVFPPDVAIVGQYAVGEDAVFLEGIHSHGIGVVARAWSHAKEAGFRVDGIETTVITDLHPGNIVADTLTFPPFDSGLEHGEVGLATGRGEGCGDVVLLACGRGSDAE